MGSYPKRKAGFDWEMCKDVADIPENRACEKNSVN